MPGFYFFLKSQIELTIVFKLFVAFDAVSEYFYLIDG